MCPTATLCLCDTTAQCDYEICLPSASYKSSDTGFCLSRALPVPALSQTSPVAIQSDLIITLAGCPPGPEQTWTFLAAKKTFITTSIMDTPQIFLQQTVRFLRDGKWTWEDGLSVQLLKGQMSHLTGCIISDKWWGKHLPKISMLSP